MYDVRMQFDHTACNSGHRSSATVLNKLLTDSRSNLAVHKYFQHIICKLFGQCRTFLVQMMCTFIQDNYSIINVNQRVTVHQNLTYHTTCKDFCVGGTEFSAQVVCWNTTRCSCLLSIVNLKQYSSIFYWNGTLCRT